MFPSSIHICKIWDILQLCTETVSLQWTPQSMSWTRQLCSRGGTDWILSASTGARESLFLTQMQTIPKRKEPQPSNSSFATAPTFGEFVSYLLATDVAEYNSHWVPVHLLCRPCSLLYTIIAKTETIERDSRCPLFDKQRQWQRQIQRQRQRQWQRQRRTLQPPLHHHCQDRYCWQTAGNIFTPNFTHFHFNHQPPSFQIHQEDTWAWSGRNRQS